MTAAYILEDVAMVENAFSADSRDKAGGRVVTYDATRSLMLHIAVSHIVQIEVVNDSKLAVPRSLVTLSSGQRYVTRNSAKDVCAAIAKATAASAAP